MTTGGSSVPDAVASAGVRGSRRNIEGARGLSRRRDLRNRLCRRSRCGFRSRRDRHLAQIAEAGGQRSEFLEARQLAGVAVLEKREQVAELRGRQVVLLAIERELRRGVELFGHLGHQAAPNVVERGAHARRRVAVREPEQRIARKDDLNRALRVRCSIECEQTQRSISLHFLDVALGLGAADTIEEDQRFVERRRIVESTCPVEGVLGLRSCVHLAEREAYENDADEQCLHFRRSSATRVGSLAVTVNV